MSFRLPKTRDTQKGQVILIVVLVMVVALTVGLSVASRSITNLRTSTEEISSQQALSAAEAGVEKALKNAGAVGDFAFANNTTYTTSVNIVRGTQILLNGGNTVPKNDSADLWLSDYSEDKTKIYENRWSGTLTIYWGSNNSACDNAALEIVVLSGNKNSPAIKKYGFDPCIARQSSNNFTAVSLSEETISGKTFYYKAELPSISSGLIARIIPLYTGASLGASGGLTALPPQGNLISSTGTSGNTTRKINVFQGYPKLPSELFPYGLFSPEF